VKRTSMRSRRGVWIAVALLAAACDEQAATGPRRLGQVTVGDDYFSPRSVMPDSDGVVTWIWGGSRSHNLVFRDGSWSVPPIAAGVHMRDFSAHAPGTYPYDCTLHAGMSGEVVVP